MGRKRRLEAFYIFSETKKAARDGIGVEGRTWTAAPMLANFLVPLVLTLPTSVTFFLPPPKAAETVKVERAMQDIVWLKWVWFGKKAREWNVMFVRSLPSF